MKYNVLEDFPLEDGRAESTTVAAGTTWTPAAIGYPRDKVDELEAKGVIELIRHSVGDSTLAPKKRRR